MMFDQHKVKTHMLMIVHNKIPRLDGMMILNVAFTEREAIGMAARPTAMVLPVLTELLAYGFGLKLTHLINAILE
jgi:hypothetical protein